MKVILACAGILLLCTTVACSRVQAKENFNIKKFKGLWYGIAMGSDCDWFKNQKKSNEMCAAIMKPKDNDDLKVIRTTSKALNCKTVKNTFKKTEQPGVFHFHSTCWGGDSEIYITDTDYERYALIYVNMTEKRMSCTFMKLLGRSKTVDQTYKDKFEQLVEKSGLDKNIIEYLNPDDMCPPPPPEKEFVFCQDYSCIVNPLTNLFHSVVDSITS
ncbi:lipocalin-like [Protopterus annectens]|uniref:lipocalin-like n=1 Tax=Protopterus annectens TaxID=7888 RepID=UPI001CFBAA4E|nr:lipocalin-like [Protopterus annectens]